MKKLLSFGVIGSIGFIVDSSLLLFFVHIADFSIVLSRSISFLTAVLITWLLNRYFTFSRNSLNMSKSREYIYYLVIQTIGAILNFSIFFVLIYMFEELKNMLIIPLAIGAIFALIFNFIMIKNKVYKNA